MKILFTVLSMGGLHGSAMYVYETARALKGLGHDVTVFSNWHPTGSCYECLASGLLDAGVKCTADIQEEMFDVQFASHFRVCGIPTVNIVHSEYDCETPLNGADVYVCIRPEIQAHIVNEHRKDPTKTRVIYNGVDFNRFKQCETPKAYATVVPCTRDMLRYKFLRHIANTATGDNPVIFVGDGPNLFADNPNVFTRPATFQIEDFYKAATCVPGILLGRVNIEARACGIPTLSYDPETLESHDPFAGLSDSEFRDRHDIQMVAHRLLKEGQAII